MKTKLTRYVSPFGSPATLDRHEAERYLAQDEQLYAELAGIGALTETQRRIGRPRLDDEQFRLSELPAWHGELYGEYAQAQLRDLVKQATRLASDRDETYVVVRRRDGETVFPRLAVMPARLVIEGDEVVWTTAEIFERRK